MPQGRWQWVIHSLCVLGEGGRGACGYVRDSNPESFVLGLCCRVCIYTVVCSEVCSGLVHLLECSQPDLAFFSYSRRSRRFLRGKWPYGFSQGVPETHPPPFLLPRPLHPRLAAEQLPRGWLQGRPLTLPTMLSLGPYGKAVKQMFISHGLALGSPKLTLPQLWLPQIRMLRPRKGRELAETHNWGLESPDTCPLSPLPSFMQ